MNEVPSTSQAAVSGSTEKPKIVKIKLLGVSAKSGNAIYELTGLDGEIHKKPFEKEAVLKAVRAYLRKPDTLPEKGLINRSNFDRIISSYKKAGQLDEKTTMLLESQAAKAKEFRRNAGEELGLAKDAQKDKAPIAEHDTSTSLSDNTKVDNHDSSDHIIANFNDGKDSVKLIEAAFRNVISQEEDIRKASSTKALIAVLPHLRFILNKPELDEKTIIKTRNDFAGKPPQERANLIKLRDAFKRDIFEGRTASLRNYFETPNGKAVKENLENLTYETIARVFSQIKHQLAKGKQANQGEIDGQVRVYQKTTQALATIAKKIGKEENLKAKKD